MKKLSLALIAAAFTISLTAGADQRQSMPLEPVYAADQARITTKSMEQEVDQFRYISDWHMAQDQLKEAELRRDQFKKDFERNKSLAEQGRVSESQLMMSRLSYESSESAVLQYKSRVEHQRTSAMVTRLKILEEGNPGTDHRQEIAGLMKKRLEFERSNIVQAKAVAELNLEFFKTRLDAGRKLLEKGVISPAALEQRILEMQSAREQLQSTVYQLAANSEAIKGLDRSQKSLP